MEELGTILLNKAVHSISKIHNGDKAIEIFSIITYFAPEINIPIEIFSNIITNERELKSAVLLLKESELVDLNENKTQINIDKTVQKAMQIRLENENKKLTVFQKAFGLFIEVGMNSSIVEHAISVWNHIISCPETTCRALNLSCLGLATCILDELGTKEIEFEKTEAFGWKALIFLSRILKKNHTVLWVFQHSFGMLLGEAGKYEKSLEVLLPLYENNMEHDGMKNSLFQIANRLRKLSKFNEALKIYQRNIICNKKLCDIKNDDEELFSVWYNYANLLQDMKKDNEASKILKEILKKQNHTSSIKDDDDDDDILSLKTKLGEIFFKKSKFFEALEIFNEIYHLKKVLFGDNHVSTMKTKDYIALCYRCQGRLDEALNIYEEISENLKKNLGPNDWCTFSSEANIAELFVQMGENTKALKAYENIYQRMRIALGEKNCNTLTIKHSLAKLLLKLKEYDKGVEILIELHDDYCENFGPNNSKTIELRNELETIKNIHCRTNIFSSVNKDNLLEDENKSMIDNVKKGNYNEVLKHILKNKEIVNAKSKDGSNALQWATYNGHKNIIKLLLKNGVDVTQITSKSNTLLHIAVSKNYKDIIEVLIKYVNPNDLYDFINAKTLITGSTAIHIAAKNGSIEIVKILLKLGAIYNIKNKSGETPIEMTKNENIINLLNLIKKLFEDAKNGNPEMIDKLSNSDEFIVFTKARNDEGNTLFKVALINKQKNISRKILKMIKKSEKNQ